MKNCPKIILKKGKDAALRRFHPWIFSGAVWQITDSLQEGDIVEVYSSSNEYLATGHYLNGSIAVKIFSFCQCEIDYSFWKEKIQSAYNLRAQTGLTESALTNAYRLVFTEGDDLPGLIIDWYNGVAVIQTHSLGMHRIKGELVEILKEIFGEKLKAVYDKSSETMKISSSESRGNKREDLKTSGTNEEFRNHYLYGGFNSVLIREIGHSFRVDWETGQKTGFFLDQRNNRMFAQFYSRNKKVLNAFCYSGAFSVYALKGGATMVHSVDSSYQALQLLEENLNLNGINKNDHKSILADVKKYFSENEDTYDLIILDPPAFAKRRNITHNALQGYIYINAQAIKRLNRGGILMTFSCSQAIRRDMFHSAILSAAIESGRKIKILHQLSQGPDHPFSIYHPEGEYLKGLILYME